MLDNSTPRNLTSIVFCSTRKLPRDLYGGRVRHVHRLATTTRVILRHSHNQVRQILQIVNNVTFTTTIRGLQRDLPGTMCTLLRITRRGRIFLVPERATRGHVLRHVNVLMLIRRSLHGPPKRLRHRKNKLAKFQLRRRL